MYRSFRGQMLHQISTPDLQIPHFVPDMYAWIERKQRWAAVGDTFFTSGAYVASHIRKKSKELLIPKH